MNIILINKSSTYKRPPIISVLYILSRLDYKVTLITCEATEVFKKSMQEQNISVIVIPTFQTKWNFLKLIDYYNFRRKSLSILKELYYKDSSLLWIADVQTILAIGNVLNNYNFILQIQELHEDARYQLNAIGSVIHNARAVFMPEYNRTILYQIWFNLKKRPIVLPNKPYFLPQKNEISLLKEKYNQLLKPLYDKKVILYQGGISRVRMLDKLASALCYLDDEYILLLLGKEQEFDYVRKIKKIYNKVIHIPYIPAPDYLIFSTIAHIGYVCYEPTSLNNVYCAPNKINEYAAYGLPMIGNDIPGLKYLFEKSNFGIIVDVSDIECIKNGIIEIESKYGFYKSNSENFFLSIDNISTIENSINRIKNETE
ncbi:MAG: hypothetical protein VB022_02330 [Rikenellaceae bacterium]|nr:hypothetical protein [Rikenellaceae bacterium]